MMTITMKQPKRSKDILKIISEHGPLTIDLLQKMVEPQMSKRNLRKSIQVLKRKNLVESVFSTNQMTYYFPNQSLPSRSTTARLLNCNPEKIQQPVLRRQDLFHNQWCEYWILNLTRALPDAEIIREDSIAGHELAKRVLQLSGADIDAHPDFLLSLPKTNSSGKCFLAFEIERTRKSEDRLTRKLRKYMDKTMLDGMIYICDSGGLSETLRLLYQNKLVGNSQRQRRFGENFFLLSDSLDGGGPQLQRLFNACGKPTSFESWCGYLASTDWPKRRDEDFRIW